MTIANREVSRQFHSFIGWTAGGNGVTGDEERRARLTQHGAPHRIILASSAGLRSMLAHHLELEGHQLDPQDILILLQAVNDPKAPPGTNKGFDKAIKIAAEKKAGFHDRIDALSPARSGFVFTAVDTTNLGAEFNPNGSAAASIAASASASRPMQPKYIDRRPPRGQEWGPGRY